MRIGAHVGISDGWAEAVRYASEVGCECIQVFTKSPRTWRANPLDPTSVAAFRAEMDRLEVAPAYVHTAYLINLGSADDALWRRSIAALADELSRAASIGAAGLVTHVGSDAYGDPRRAAERIGDAIADARVALRTRGDDAGLTEPLLLENTAGAGRSFGGPISELATLLRRVEDARGGPASLCLDTCHAHANGIRLTTSEDWSALLDELEEAAGPGRVALLHANDCAHPRGSLRDRHAWVGEGMIGAEGFSAMFAEPRLAGVDAIVEMPGELPVKDRENVSRLKRMRDVSDDPGD